MGRHLQPLLRTFASEARERLQHAPSLKSFLAARTRLAQVRTVKLWHAHAFALARYKRKRS